MYPDGTYVYVIPRPGLQISVVPDNAGAVPISSDDWVYHAYSRGLVPLPADIPDDVLADIYRNAWEVPTAGPDNHPATPLGTPNDVGEIGVGPFSQERNMVMSYEAPHYSDTYDPAVINITVAGEHLMEPGYVMRTRLGNIFGSHGEGTTPSMQPLIPGFLKNLFLGKYWWPLNRKAVDDALANDSGGGPMP